MLLALDVGNTQTTFALFDVKKLIKHWAFATRDSDTADESYMQLAQWLYLANISPDDIDSFVIASVVPVLTQNWQEVGRRITGTDALTVGPGVKTGLNLHYDNPVEVGADLVADAVAARALMGDPVIAVDLGTATTIQVIDRRGHFCGGIITPGVRVSMLALFEHTACLPQVNLSRPKKVIGTNTDDAIRSGLIYGEAARIDGLVRQIFAEASYEMPVVATGGFSAIIAGLSQTITACEPLLTLQGLRLIYEQNI